MIQEINIYKLNKEIHISMKSILPMLPIFVYDIKQVLWANLDVNISDAINQSNNRRIYK